MKTIQLTLTEEQALQIELALVERLELVRYFAPIAAMNETDAYWVRSLESTQAAHAALQLALYNGNPPAYGEAGV